MYYLCLWGQLSTTCSNATETARCASHNCSRPQSVWTILPDTVDPIDYCYHPPSWAAPAERLLHSINLCDLYRESTSQPSAYKSTTLYAPIDVPTYIYRGRLFAVDFPLLRNQPVAESGQIATISLAAPSPAAFRNAPWGWLRCPGECMVGAVHTFFH